MNLLKQALLYITLLGLVACSHSPSTEQTKEAIMDYYMEQSRSSGGGSFSITDIIIVSSNEVDEEKCLVKARVKGTHENHSLPENHGPSAVDYENEYTLEKQNKIWIVKAIR